jgi:hypothetical protein
MCRSAIRSALEEMAVEKSIMANILAQRTVGIIPNGHLTGDDTRKRTNPRSFGYVRSAELAALIDLSSLADATSCYHTSRKITASPKMLPMR